MTHGPTANLFEQYAAHQGVLMLDGGLATALEAHGMDLNDDLWSAKVLIEAPDAIGQVHHEFLAAGADCIASASYQASLEGFRRRGIDADRGVELLRESVRLAVEARDAFWRDAAHPTGRLRPLVAASVGPFGAFLADGSEYTGTYAIDDDALYEFHRTRWHVLAETPADLLACETIPSGREVAVLLRLLWETPDRLAWLSFSCRDEAHLCDGTPIAEVARACDAVANVAAVGVNCVKPEMVPSLLAALRTATGKPLIAYPNSGEHYQAGTRTWGAGRSAIDWVNAAREWVRMGAKGVGGCCRVGPAEIAELRAMLVG